MLGAAIVAVIVLNAVFAFAQERQAERAVEALARYLPQQATVRRDGERRVVDARELVPGDVLLLEEGDRISADARLLARCHRRRRVDADRASRSRFSARPSSPTPPGRCSRRASSSSAGRRASAARRRRSSSRPGCTPSSAASPRSPSGWRCEESPLEHQVRRVAWLIALVAVAVGLAFLPIGWLAAGLPLQDAFTFAIGLIVANVPEGLLPTLTLALAVGVAGLARRGALVKRLSAVETLGSTTVICTDKTGTLTENRMRAVRDLDTARRARSGGRDAMSTRPLRADPVLGAARAHARGVLDRGALPGAGREVARRRDRDRVARGGAGARASTSTLRDASTIDVRSIASTRSCA